MDHAVSIITVCYRNPEELDLTLNGLSTLDEALFQVIVIDGSPDNSCAEVAARYPAIRHLHAIDTGKYDAMNKGIVAAQGESLLFMNSGDRVASTEILTKIVRQNLDKLSSTIIFGDCIRVVAGEPIYIPAPKITPEHIRKGILPSHQSILIPASFHLSNNYDEGMYFAADTKLLKEAFRTLPHIHSPEAIGVFAYGGACTSPGSWSLLIRQYRELCEVEESQSLERLRTAFALFRRKIARALLGNSGLQKVQARRLLARLNQSTSSSQVSG